MANQIERSGIRAAVVRSFERPPRYEPFELPAAAGRNDVVVDVLAAGLHPRVRSGAAGEHYADDRTLPMIPGVDGVGRLPDGRRVYFVVHDTPLGTMAEKTIADVRRCVPVPEDADEAVIAAAMNPAMSSWLALRLRVPLSPGQQVLVLGATGNAGAMAVQVARRLGAGRVIAAGRDAARLRTLEADAIVTLDQSGAPDEALAQAAADVDVVIDYLWGAPTERAMLALLTARTDRSAPLGWIQVGSVAGPTMSLPSAALRSTNLRILGSGQGSISVAGIVAELPALVAEIAAGTFKVDAVRVPLSRVESAWNEPVPRGQRLVFVP